MQSRRILSVHKVVLISIIHCEGNSGNDLRQPGRGHEPERPNHREDDFHQHLRGTLESAPQASWISEIALTDPDSQRLKIGDLLRIADAHPIRGDTINQPLEDRSSEVA